MSNIQKKMMSVSSREDFVKFIEDLRQYFNSEETEWENDSLDSYLEALSAYTNAIGFGYKNAGRELPENIPWNVFADILFYSSNYE